MVAPPEELEELEDELEDELEEDVERFRTCEHLVASGRVFGIASNIWAATNCVCVAFMVPLRQVGFLFVCFVDTSPIFLIDAVS